jgi:hypothetical protein
VPVIKPETDADGDAVLLNEALLGPLTCDHEPIPDTGVFPLKTAETPQTEASGPALAAVGVELKLNTRTESVKNTIHPGLYIGMTLTFSVVVAEIVPLVREIVPPLPKADAPELEVPETN